MAEDITPAQQAVIDAAQLIDAVFVEWSTFAMPKELRVALNTLHQRVRALTDIEPAAQGDLVFEEPGNALLERSSPDLEDE